jgi:hypothetical protein
MRVKLILLFFIIILPGCSNPENVSPKSLIYIADNYEEKDTPIVYEIDQGKSSHEWLKETALERRRLSQIRAINEYEEGLARYEKVNKYKNIIRSIDGNRILGYLDEIDNKDFEKIK